jgi:hypothetical protein
MDVLLQLTAVVLQDQRRGICQGFLLKFKCLLLLGLLIGRDI